MPKINVGYDTNFFQLITISNTEFPDDSSVKINIKDQQCVSLVNYGSATVEYSFNGNILHGDLRPDTPTEGVIFDNRRVDQIWLRSPTGVACEIRVEAWAKHC